MFTRDDGLALTCVAIEVMLAHGGGSTLPIWRLRSHTVARLRTCSRGWSCHKEAREGGVIVAMCGIVRSIVTGREAAQDKKGVMV